MWCLSTQLHKIVVNMVAAAVGDVKFGVLEVFSSYFPSFHNFKTSCMPKCSTLSKGKAA